MVSALAGNLVAHRNRVDGTVHRLRRAEPPVAAYRHAVAGQAQTLRSGAVSEFTSVAAQLAGAAAQLEALNPHAVLKRGFAIVQKEGTKRRPVVTSVRKVKGGDRLAISLGDGAFWAEVS
jgi:exodeoxyribonuclease VII large subunit